MQHSQHTFLNSSSTTGFSETIALTNRTAETDVHEALSVGWQRSTTRQHHTHSATEQLPHFLEDDSVTVRIQVASGKARPEKKTEHWYTHYKAASPMLQVIDIWPIATCYRPSMVHINKCWTRWWALQNSWTNRDAILGGRYVWAQGAIIRWRCTLLPPGKDD